MSEENKTETTQGNGDLAVVVHRFFRILRLRLIDNYQNCDYCNRFTNKIYSIPYIEAGFLVCKKCTESDNGA